MKKISIFFFTLFAVFVAISSCQKADSDKEWGFPLIYMPQAKYEPYRVPGGSMDDNNGNQNYRVDKAAGVVNIFLGVYRGGLQKLQSYSVSVTSGSDDGTSGTLLPDTAYSLPASVTCPDGKRDAGFYLAVDITYLKANADKSLYLKVSISNPTRYELNESLVSTIVRIDTSDLIEKGNL